MFLIQTLSSFLIVFTGNINFVKNPYIRSKLVEVLYEMFPHDENNNFSKFVPIFETHPFAIKHLVPALIELYVDIETTGSNDF